MGKEKAPNGRLGKGRLDSFLYIGGFGCEIRGIMEVFIDLFMFDPTLYQAQCFIGIGLQVFLWSKSPGFIMLVN